MCVVQTKTLVSCKIPKRSYSMGITTITTEEHWT